LQGGRTAGLGTVGTQASLQSLNTLLNNLSASVANGELTASQARLLYRDVITVLNSGPNNQLAVAVLQADVAALQTATRLTTQDLQLITDNIAAALQSSPASLQATGYLATTTR
jgi:hypothetical protein